MHPQQRRQWDCCWSVTEKWEALPHRIQRQRQDWREPSGVVERTDATPDLRDAHVLAKYATFSNVFLTSHHVMKNDETGTLK